MYRLRVIAASNTRLEQLKADARLVDAGGSMQAPQDPAVPAGAQLTLKMVKPGETPAGQPPRVLEKFGQVSECNAFIKYLIGDLTERVAVFGPGRGHEAVVDEKKEPTQAIATFAATTMGDGQALAANLTRRARPGAPTTLRSRRPTPGWGERTPGIRRSASTSTPRRASARGMS